MNARELVVETLVEGGQPGEQRRFIELGASQRSVEVCRVEPALDHCRRGLADPAGIRPTRRGVRAFHRRAGIQGSVLVPGQHVRGDAVHLRDLVPGGAPFHLRPDDLVDTATGMRGQGERSSQIRQRAPAVRPTGPVQSDRRRRSPRRREARRSRSSTCRSSRPSSLWVVGPEPTWCSAGQAAGSRQYSGAPSSSRQPWPTNASTSGSSSAAGKPCAYGSCFVIGDAVACTSASTSQARRQGRGRSGCSRRLPEAPWIGHAGHRPPALHTGSSLGPQITASSNRRYMGHLRTRDGRSFSRPCAQFAVRAIGGPRPHSV